MVLYRAGQFEAAIQRLNQSIALHGRGGTPWDWLFLAMAHGRLGHMEEARRWLEKAVPAVEQALQPRSDPRPGLSPWPGYAQTMRIVRLEAEAMLSSPRP
jgi:hypothetical protein